MSETCARCGLEQDRQDQDTWRFSRDVCISALQAALARAERFDGKMATALERARPMCSDHRDKFGGQPCLGCTIETLRLRLAEAVEALNNCGAARGRTKEWIMEYARRRAREIVEKNR